MHIDLIHYKLLAVNENNQLKKVERRELMANRGSNYMQKAIQKASKLIELLTKENLELKNENIAIQQQLDQHIAQNKQLKSKLEQIQRQNNEMGKENLQVKQKISVFSEQIRIAEAKIVQKGNKNKQLYEKIGEYVQKNQQLAKIIQKERKKSLSLTNQNQYLIKNVKKSELKQNQANNYMAEVQTQFKKEIQLVDRTKQAFARKCQQLKIQNGNLHLQLINLSNKLDEAIGYKRMSEQYLQKMHQLEEELKKSNQSLCYLIESTLRVKAEQGICHKVEQIKHFLNYRLQHIENLIVPIIQCLSRQNKECLVEWKRIEDLQMLGIFANRLSSYVNELIK